MNYKIIYGPLVRSELDLLEKGNTNQRKRYQDTIELIKRIQKDPKSTTYIKQYLSHYRVGDIGTRYRLFFELKEHCKTGNYIHLVWLNSESQQHRSGSAFDPYQIFKNMVADGFIPQFIEPPSISSPIFKMGKWGASFLYASLETNKPQSANTSLILEQQSKSSYRISDRITVDPDDDIPFAQLLIKHICSRADIGKIQLSMELRTSQIDYDLHVAALTSNEFIRTLCTENEEIWERSPRKK